MSLKNRERLLRLKTLRAEKAAAALSAAQVETATQARAERAAKMTLQIRQATEKRMYAQTYRNLVGRPLDGGQFDTVDGTLIALAEATATASTSMEKATARLTDARSAEDAARKTSIAAYRAKDVWDKLVSDGQAEESQVTNARDINNAEATIEAAGLANWGAKS